MNRFLIAGVLIVAGLSAVAGGWNLTAGPAWRARVKSEISGGISVATPSAYRTAGYDRDVPGKSSWSSADVTSGVVVEKDDPDYPGLGLTKWAATANWTDAQVVPNSGLAAVRGSDERGPLGLRVNGGYDWDVGERFSLGVNVMFAGYWDMKAEARGAAGGGVRTVSGWTDYYLFDGGVVPPDSDISGMSPNPTPYLPYRDGAYSRSELIPGRSVSARIRSDLYQIGIGPKATWHALDWLDVYGGVNALCNLANMNLSTSAGSSSEVQCRFGIGANLGLAAYLTEWFGLYADVGYEWVDKASTSCNGVSADVDYSSLVLSAGAVFSF